MADDLATFALAFSVVWIAIGAYLVYLHRLAERLAREMARLEEKGERPKE